MGVHNGAHRMKVAIDSIIQQTYTNWEFIICDDGSTDNSFEILKEYQKNDPRFIIIENERNSGLPYTLNHCIENCKGDFIARMDDDDLCYRNRFEEQIKFLNEHPDISFVSSSIDNFDGSKITGRRMLKPFPTKVDMVWQTQFVHPATMFRADDLKSVGCYRVAEETRRGQDYDLFMRMYGAGFKGANLQEPVYRYLMDAQNIKRRTFRARIGEFKIRLHGYKAMKVLWWAFPFLFKPFAAHLVQSLKYRNMK